MGRRVNSALQLCYTGAFHAAYCPFDAVPRQAIFVWQRDLGCESLRQRNYQVRDSARFPSGDSGGLRLFCGVRHHRVRNSSIPPLGGISAPQARGEQSSVTLHVINVSHVLDIDMKIMGKQSSRARPRRGLSSQSPSCAYQGSGAARTMHPKVK